MRQKVLDRFLKYVSFYTESKPHIEQIPSTKRQFALAEYLVDELKEIGVTEVSLDENCYVMATLKSNSQKQIPAIGFIAHMDTSPDFSGENVKPQIIENYDGKDIILNKELDIVLKTENFPELLKYKNQTIITTDGTTLLGADDKAGIAEIMTAIEYIIQKNIEHGDIKIGFTPDEEVGKGAHLFDVKKFGAQWAYTMDGSEVGELEYENFNAAYAKIIFSGVSVHPGYAKGKMVNSIKLANDFVSSFNDNNSPETTSGRQGFFHIYKINGGIEKTEVEMIIRDHDRDKFEARKKLLSRIVSSLNEDLKGDIVSIEIKDQYYNMREKIEPVFHIVELAEKAMIQAGIKPNIKPIRGGTDGSQLSFKGLPCPNIFAGGHNFHGKFEYIPVESMEKASEVIVNIVTNLTQKS